MFASFSRSYALARHSWAILRQDKDILMFPVLSGLASLLVAASFLIPFVLAGVKGLDAKEDLSPTWYPLLFLFYERR